MRLFINDGIFQRNWNKNVKIEELLSSKVRITITNYLASEIRHEYIKFIFSDIDEDMLEKDILLDNVSLTRVSKNKYYITSSDTQEQPYMYALLRSAVGIPDDIFIPASMKNNVTVLRRIQFLDNDEFYGEFLSNVYLVKIKLDLGESLPMYLASERPNKLEEHYVFYKKNRSKRYCVSEKMSTHIHLSKNNKDEYISLSELCK